MEKRKKKWLIWGRSTREGDEIRIKIKKKKT